MPGFVFHGWLKPVDMCNTSAKRADFEFGFVWHCMRSRGRIWRGCDETRLSGRRYGAGLLDVPLERSWRGFSGDARGTHEFWQRGKFRIRLPQFGEKDLCRYLVTSDMKGLYQSFVVMTALGLS